MKDALRVQSIEARGDSRHDLEESVELERAGLRDPLLERFPLNVTNGEVVVVPVLSRIDDRYEVRVIDLASGARLMSEALAKDRVLGKLFLEDLESNHFAAVARCPIDNPNGSLTQFLVQNESPDPGP
jgi:hypothetical protein